MSTTAGEQSLSAQNARLRQVLKIARELGGNLELEALLPDIIAHVTEVMEADRSSLFLHDPETHTLWTLVAQGLDVNEIRIPVGSGISGHVATTRENLNITDAYACDFFDRSFDQKTGYRTRSVLCLPLNNRRGELLGVIQVLNKKGEAAFSEEDMDFLITLSGQIAILLENAHLYRKIETTFDNVVTAIARAIDSRDPVTAGHSRRVSQFTMQIARGIHHEEDGPFAAVRFSRNQMRELRYASLLHDFGKVGVPEMILQKAERLEPNGITLIDLRLQIAALNREMERLRHNDSGTTPGDFDAIRAFLEKVNRSGFLNDDDAARLRTLHDDGLITPAEYHALSIRKGTLTDEEREIMQSHVAKTLTVLSAIAWPEGMRDIPRIAASHHEAENGRGYPLGLTADQIPLGGKCMAVADVYDALTAQDRPYKPAIPHEKSCAILRDMAAQGQLNPDIVALFIDRELFVLPPEFHQAG